MQKLILPLNAMHINASYKAEAYRERFTFTHYGFDVVSKSSRTIYASGLGKVLLVGNDSVVGNVVIIQYSDAINHKTGKVADVIMRYFHLKDICVEKDEAVTKDTKIGDYGNSGKYSTGPHLHFEFDSDVSAPTYTSTLKGNSSLLHGAKSDSSVDPTELLFIKASNPDCQSISADLSCHKGKRYAMPECTQLPQWEP